MFLNTIIKIRVRRLIRTRELALCLLFIGCSYPIQVFANDLDNLFDLSLKELTQTPITGSTLRPESIEHVPSAVTAFSQAHLGTSGFETLDEIMNVVPGFQSYRTSGASLQVGFSSRGRRISPGAAEVLIIVDGVRYQASGVAGASVALAKYPISFIERVEFIRGPGGALYGSNAMLGVINIVTRKNEHEFQISLGSNNKKQLSWLGNIQWQGWTFDVAGFWQQDHGSLINAPEENVDPFETARDPYRKGNLNLTAKRGSTELLAQYDYANEEDFYANSTPANDVNFGKFKTINVAVKQKLETDFMSSTLQLAFGQSVWDSGSQLFPAGALQGISAPASDAALVQHYELGDQNQWQLLWHSQWKGLKSGEFSWGVEYRLTDNDTIKGFSNYDTTALFFNQLPIRYFGDIAFSDVVAEAQKRDIFGAYVQYQHPLLNDTLQLTLGGRFDHFASIGEQFSPRLGVVYEATEHHYLKLLYGEAFRAPAHTELASTNNPLLAGNLSLTPESVRTWDVIWQGRWPNLNLQVGYFENHFENAIVQAFNPVLGLDQFQNLAQDPVKGWELEGRWKLSQSWALYGAYTHFTEQPELSFKEADTISSLGLSFDRGAWKGTLGGIYSSERLTPPDTNQEQIETEDYWRWHFNVNYSIRPHLDLHFKIKNLLDKEYFTPADVAAEVKLIPNRGREWQLGLTWDY